MLLQWIAQWRKRELLRRELAGLDANGSLDAVLADAGLVRSQLGPLIDGDRSSPELLGRMLAKRRIAAGELPIESRREMAWTCMTCTDKRRCREWLSEADETEFRAFCPNAAELDYAVLKQRCAPARPQSTP